MRVPYRLQPHRALLLIALALSLVVGGLGHRMPVPQDDALRFAIANGATAEDFCGGDPADMAHPGVTCLACQPLSVPQLSGFSGVCLPLTPAMAASAVPAPLAMTAGWWTDPAHPSQGPPRA